MTVAVVTLCSESRLGHLENQLASLDGSATPIVVWLGADEPPPLEASTTWVPPGVNGLRLAAARNGGGRSALEAGASVIVFLDADCVAGPGLVDGYRAAAARHPGAILSGPVTYLPEGHRDLDATALVAATDPHPARPAPPAGETVAAAPDDYRLFWSLSFAMSAEGWASGPRFDERYEGYGGEDTDFAFAARERNIPLLWVGGAHAYHQYHPTQSPPWQHLDDILRNGAVFAERWGSWPMEGWLAAFAEAGAIEWADGRWRRSGQQVEDA